MLNILDNLNFAHLSQIGSILYYYFNLCINLV